MHQSYPTTLIICQPRATFLASLLQCVPHVLPKRHRPAPPPSYQQPESALVDEEDLDSGHDQGDGEASRNKSENENDEPEKRHHLLIPTLHQIATSRDINTVFMPSVSHLRAYLAVFSSKQDKDEQKLRAKEFSKSGTKIPLLVVYGLVGSHKHTSEWSAQGLGLSLSTLVDASDREERGVVLVEELEYGWDAGTELDVDARLEERKQLARKTWEERVPILNGSTRKFGIESEDGGWSGRTVEVGRVVNRWFRFKRAEWDE